MKRFKSKFFALLVVLVCLLFSGSVVNAETFNASSKEYRVGSLTVVDQGTCILDGATGTCPAINLSKTYRTAPNCVATWNGTGNLTGIVRATSTTTGLTVDSSVNGDTGVMNWVCFGY